MARVVTRAWNGQKVYETFHTVHVVAQFVTTRGKLKNTGGAEAACLQQHNVPSTQLRAPEDFTGKPQDSDNGPTRRSRTAETLKRTETDSLAMSQQHLLAGGWASEAALDSKPDGAALRAFTRERPGGLRSCFASRW
eukprot:CAMPEP_0117666764 /NCGR_PEP_ID=MMETSP0804-20121206/10563_1 /TAXON_ID=1074897 /ORGANISM="Tetraselmis astigmatica, Strain CCMP880" /LENGTH=136 /DNA_ID=CAMNT_0005474357 /DNA_START=908 /DNA_END=1317 /DNA_ORIENTATION=-